MMAQERKIVEEAYAGDIIGVFDPGIFSIGDTLCAPKDNIKYAAEDTVKDTAHLAKKTVRKAVQKKKAKEAEDAKREAEHQRLVRELREAETKQEYFKKAGFIKLFNFIKFCCNFIKH